MICTECKHINEDKSLICSNCGCDLEQYKSESKVDNKRIESLHYKKVNSNTLYNDSDLNVDKTAKQYTEERDKTIRKIASREIVFKHKPILNGQILLGIFCLGFLHFLDFLFYFLEGNKITLYKPNTILEISNGNVMILSLLLFFLFVGIFNILEGIKSLRRTRKLYDVHKNDNELLKIELARQWVEQQECNELIKNISKNIPKNKSNSSPKGLPLIITIPAIILLRFNVFLSLIWFFASARILDKFK